MSFDNIPTIQLQFAYREAKELEAKHRLNVRQLVALRILENELVYRMKENEPL